MIIAFDFDGTVVDNRFPDIGAAVPGATEVLRSLQEADHRLILWTMRTDDAGREKGPKALSEAVEWLRIQRIKPWGINENPTQKHWAPLAKKAYAELYIDDAGLGVPIRTYPGFIRPAVDWEQVRILLVTAGHLEEI